MSFPSGSVVKNASALQETQEMWVQSLAQEDSLEESMATHSSILTWRILWTEEPGGLQSIGLQRVRHDWSNLACTPGYTLLLCLLIQRHEEPKTAGISPSSLPVQRNHGCVSFFIYFGLCWVFVAAHGHSLVRVEATLHCSVCASHCSGSPGCKAQVPGRSGFSSCGTQA